MRKVVVSLALALALAAAYTVEAGYRVVQLGDVIALARQGVSDRTIVSYLETRELGFVVGTDEILRLRQAGVGEPVILYLIERTAPRKPEPSGAYEREPGNGGARIEYGRRDDVAYYVNTLGPYVADVLVSWLERTLGVGPHYGGYYSNGYDHGHHRYYDGGRSYHYDGGHGNGYDGGGTYRYDGGGSHGCSYAYSSRSHLARSYRVSYIHSSDYGDHGGH
jgi:hypothetical protein